MTVTYTRNIATTSYSTFLGVLTRWRGSVYKLVWCDTLVYLILYGTLSCLYRFAFNETLRLSFEDVCLYSQKLCNLIPVSFILGFYVGMVANRWWNQFSSLPWPDAIALNLTAYVDGKTERAVMVRRTVIRYANLSLALCLRSIASPAKKLFPELESLVEVGLITDDEFAIFKSVDPRFNRFYVPLIWAVNIISRARNENLIRIDPEQNIIIDEIDNFRNKLNTLFIYDWVNPPLVYTQVSTMSVYMYFLLALFGRQFLDPSKNYDGQILDMYVPFFTILQFIFYMGWLKVAEVLLNPFGDDDDDFDVGYLLERNLEFSYTLVDKMHHEHPELIKDAYWDALSPQLPYTAATKPEPTNGSIFAGSLMNLEMRMSGLDLSQKSESLHSSSLGNDLDVVVTSSHNPRFSISNVSLKRRSISARDL